MTTRRSVGKVILRIEYLGACVFTQALCTRDEYLVSLALAGQRVEKMTVHAPACGFGPGVSFDSPEAYDQIARAAISLSDNEDVQCEAASQRTESGQLFVARARSVRLV